MEIKLLGVQYPVLASNSQYIVVSVSINQKVKGITSVSIVNK